MMPHEWPKTKSYVAGKDLFLFSVFCIVTKKTGNIGAGKLCGRAHPMADGVYLLYRLLEDDSTKSYGEEKTNRNSTDNSSCRRHAYTTISLTSCGNDRSIRHKQGNSAVPNGQNSPL